MLIRSLQWRELPVWPPEWWISDQELGEAGVLEAVQLRDDLQPRLISVVANYLGESRKGMIILEDPVQLGVLYHKLKENLGRPLEEIGDLDIDLSPSLRKRAPEPIKPSSAIIITARIVT